MPIETLEQCAAQPDEQIDLARAALLLARELRYPDLAPDGVLAQLDALADAVRPRLAGRAPRERLERLIQYLFFELRFRGNSVDYHDPRNSYLNDVLARRLGLPITLSLVFIEAARRLGFEAYGVGLPGHFVAAAVIGDAPVYLDPFNAGALLDTATMTALVQRATERPALFDAAWLQPVPARAFLARMCGNLQNIYVMQLDWARAVLVTERLYLLTRAPVALRDLGYMAFQAGQLSRAAEAFEAYLVAVPDAEDAGTVRDNVVSVYRRLARLN